MTKSVIIRFLSQSSFEMGSENFRGTMSDHSRNRLVYGKFYRYVSVFFWEEAVKAMSLN